MGYTPGQLLDGMRVDLGAVQLGMVDAAGVAWRVGSDGLQGWDGSDVRTQVTDREADHGAWMGPVYLGSRPITLAGTIAAPDTASLDVAVEQLLAACSLTDTTLTVWESTPKQCTVRRSGKPVVKRETSTIATWSLMVTAADPRRYGTDEHVTQLYLPMSSGGLSFPITSPLTIPATVVSGDADLPNDGTIGSRPRILIYGPVSQPSITVTLSDGSTSTLLYGDDIAAGDWVDLDCDVRTAYYNSQSSRRSRLSGDWPEIPPGGATLAFRAPVYSSTAYLVASHRSAWM